MTSSVSNKVYMTEADYIYRCAVIKFLVDKRGEVRSANPDLRASAITEKLYHMWECMSEEDRGKYISLVEIRPKTESELAEDESEDDSDDDLLYE